MKARRDRFLILCSLALAFSLSGIEISAADKRKDVQTGPVDANYTWVIAEPVNMPQRFEGGDGNFYLCYELVLTNFSSAEIELAGIDVRDGTDEAVVIKPIDAGELAKITRGFSNSKSTTKLGAGATAVVYINIQMSNDDPVPKSLVHLISYERKPRKGKKEFVSKTIGRTAVKSSPPVVIGAPVRGGRWVAVGSFNARSGHRFRALPVNGTIRNAQRFAVDWTKIDADDRVSIKEKKIVKGLSYGESVIAVADAKVVGVVDSFDDQPFGKASGNNNFPWGNSVILKLPHDRYALYAHLKKGSITVKEGAKVKKGQELGLIGSSGNTPTPHLHFQITSSQKNLAGSGIPYTIDQYRFDGRVADMQSFAKSELTGKALKVLPSKNETRSKQLPDDGAIVTFESPSEVKDKKPE